MEQTLEESWETSSESSDFSSFEPSDFSDDEEPLEMHSDVSEEPADVYIRPIMVSVGT